MDFASIAIAATVFILLYQGIGLFLESRQSRAAAWARRSGQDNALASALQNTIHKVSDMGLNRAILRNKKFSEKLDLLLVRSGNVFGWNIEALLFYKELGGVLGLLFMWKLNISKPLAWIAAAYI